MEDNTFKTIIIVCLIAIVAILGISAYFFINNTKTTAINGTPSTQSANITVQNSTPVTEQSHVNKSTKNSISTQSGKSLISKSQAYNAMRNYLDGYGPDYLIKNLYLNKDDEQYVADVVDKSGSKVGFIQVDGVSGRVVNGEWP